ncbi:MAG: AMP-binding protein [Prevotella sp.]|nr:AMP-binding protein [Bacteroides sp.]MCM1366525.1 AMP-binding protein [Prevotella sp.]
MTVDEFILEWNNKNDYCIAMTSGSTGTPKEINLPKELMKQSALRTINYFGLNNNSHLHLPLSPDYIAGKMMIVRSLMCGAHLSYETPSNIIVGNSDESPIDLIALVPSQLQGLISQTKLLSRIKNIIVGGAPLSTELRQESSKLPVKIVETYGMTETASHIALRDVSEEYFTPLDKIKINTNHNNELIIEIPNFGKFITNDIAEILPDNRFRILGRSDNVIITGGIKVNPETLENKISPILSELFNINRFAITSISNLKWGQSIMLVIEGEKQYPDDEIIITLKKRLPKYEIPKSITYIDKIPLTPNGKIMRRLLIS